MLRITTVTFSIGLLCCLPRPALANSMFLYQTCMKNDSNRNAIQFQAALNQGGLFFEWSGFSATVKDGKCATPEVWDEFKGSNAKGTQLFAENLMKQVPGPGFMVLQDVDNGENFNKTGNSTTFGGPAATTLATVVGSTRS
jgi:hypothetical protein